MISTELKQIIIKMYGQDALDEYDKDPLSPNSLIMKMKNNFSWKKLNDLVIENSNPKQVVIDGDVHIYTSITSLCQSLNIDSSAIFKFFFKIEHKLVELVQNYRSFIDSDMNLFFKNLYNTNQNKFHNNYLRFMNDTEKKSMDDVCSNNPTLDPNKVIDVFFDHKFKKSLADLKSKLEKIPLSSLDEMQKLDPIVLEKTLPELLNA